MRKFIGFALLLFATAASADSLPPGQMLIVRDPNVAPNPFGVDRAQPVRGGIRFHELYASADSLTTLPALVNLGSAPPCGAAEKTSSSVCADQVMVQCFDPFSGWTLYYGPACGLVVREGGVLTWTELTPNAHRYIATLGCDVTGIGDD